MGAQEPKPTHLTPLSGGISHWYNEIGIPEPADQLTGDVDCDVVIVGAGYTGLWTAYYLARANPTLDIRVVERRFAGFGASGRNGGWLTASITGGLDTYARLFPRELVSRFQVAMNDTVDEVIAVSQREGIDAHIRKGGTLLVARNPAQLERAEELAVSAARWPEIGGRLLTAEESRERIDIAGALAGFHEPHCARIHPARLVRGLAETVRRLGVHIHEATSVTEISPGLVGTDRGWLRTRHIVRATEGFTADLPGEHRTWVPMNSSMIITDPVPQTILEQIGWQHGDTLEDLSHVYSYAQITEDGRIAIGGRGNPYRYASRTDNDGSVDPETIAALRRTLVSWFPAVADVPIAHGWSGVLGVPRNWRATVGYDHSSGIGWAGGYVGTGVAATNLAGRTLTDLILGERSDLTILPWVDQRARRWEPEPLRWIGIHGLYRAYGIADRLEFNGRRRTAPIARVANLISGR